MGLGIGMPEGRIIRALDSWALSCLLGLPVLGAAMACMWFAREVDGAIALVLGGATLALVLLALTGAAALPRIRAGVPLGRALPPAAPIAVASLLLASGLSLVEGLVPDVGFASDRGFYSSQLTYAAVVAALAFAAYAVGRFKTHAGPAGYAAGLLLAIAGVALWAWSAGEGYIAVQASNADAIVLMGQPITLFALVLSGAAASALAARSA